MGYIYVIENDVNDKIYVGKTTDTLSNRFSKHCWEAINQPQKTSPLHSAMAKYGVNHFSIRLLEECENSLLSEREIYWIDKLNLYLDKNKGYNGSRGGEGNLKYNSQEIISLWNQGYNQTQIAQKLGCERHTISKYLNDAGINFQEKQSFKFGNATKIVYQIDKNTKEVIAEYPSVTTAAEETGSTISGISLVCNGKRKTHNNYIWAYKINC